jgi:hypothetical protein
VIDSLKKIDVLKGFPCARLEREHECGVWRVPDRSSQPLQEDHRLITEGCLMDLYSACADKIGEHLVEEDQIGLVAQKSDDFVAALGDTALILQLEVFVALPSAERPRDPAPHRPRSELLAGNYFPARSVEELSVEHRRARLCRLGQAPSLGDDVQGLPAARGVKQRR